MFCSARWTRTLFVLLVAVLVGCSDEPIESDIGVGCRLNSDCPTAQICDDGQCIESDICVGAQCPCGTDEDCPNGLVCDADTGECAVPQCTADTDCSLGEICQSGRCTTDVDADRDADGVPDAQDTCPDVENTDQNDNDGDGEGDACDADDDNDGVPDTADNCPLATNTDQNDANADGVGNACDDDVRGWGVTGRLDFSALGNPDTSDAQVFVSNRAEPVGINAEGQFVFEQVLTAKGPFAIRVVWPGFNALERVFDNPGEGPVVDVGTLALVPQAVGEDAVQMRGVATLQGQDAHQGIMVQALIGGVPVSSTLTDETGAWVLSAGRVDHTVKFTKDNHLPEELEIVFDTEAARFETGGEPLETFEVALRPDTSASLTGRLDSDRLAVQDWSAQIRAVVLQGGGGESTVDVQPDGTFASDDVMPGNYVLDIDARGHFRQARAVILTPGEADLGVVTLTAEIGEENATAQMRGTATLAGQDFHAGITIRALIGNTLAAVGTTDQEGGFVLLTARDNHTVEFSAPGFVTETLAVTFSDRNGRFEVLGEALEDFDGVVLQPERNAAISGQLATSIEGFDFSGAEVSLSGREEAILAVQSDGGFAQSGLAPGLYVLRAEADGHEPFERLVELASGDNDQGAVVLDPIQILMLGKIVSRVDGEETPLEGVSVRLRRDDQLVAATDTDERGEFVFNALPVPYSLSLSAANFLSRTVDVDVDGEGFAVDGAPLRPDVPLVLVRAPESDVDSDGIIDVLDNCPEDFNINQRDIDGDGPGDACDNDADGDGLVNGLDNCPFSPNPMQDDTDGLGRGTVCSLGTAERPLDVGCGVQGQRLDTRELEDRFLSRCGGAGAPELVYALGINEGETWTVAVDAQHSVALSLFDALGREVDCAVGGLAQFGDGLASGQYLLVVDGLSGPDNAGPVEVSIASPVCGHTLLGPELIQAGVFPGDLAVGDINGDGHADIVSIRSRVEVFLNNGQGGFAPPQPFAVGDQPRRVALGDLNGDGFLDIATISDGRDDVSLLLSVGPGDFAPFRSIGDGGSIAAIAIEDLNEDNALDIAIVDLTRDTATVFFGDGQGGFPDSETLETGDGPVDITVGFLDGDGLLDVVTADISGSISAFLGQGQGTFSERIPINVGRNIEAVRLGDFNEDGITDVAAASTQSNGVAVRLGLGQSRFAPTQNVAVGESPRWLELGDFNGDTHTDIVTRNEASDDFSLLLGDGQGGFDALTFDAGGSLSESAVGDLDGDGALDVVAGISGALELFLGNKQGSFGPHRTFRVGKDPRGITVGDIDDDGNLDIATANSDDDDVSLLLGDGIGGFASARTFAVGESPQSVSMGDLNGDGLLDVATANLSSNNLSLLFGDGEGGFEDQRQLDVGTNCRTAAIADINEDGVMDVATALSVTDEVALFLGSGGGQFQQQNVDGFNGFLVSVAVGNVGRNGLNDLVTGSRSSGLTVRFGQSNATFRAPLSVEIDGVDRMSNVVLGDINGDGRGDVVVPDSDNDILIIQRFNGLGTALTPTILDVGEGSSKAALGDLNRDGHLDIVAVSGVIDKVSVLLNDGSGSFDGFLTFAVGRVAESVAVGDFNGDGLLDIATANSGGDDVSALLTRQFPLQAVSFVDSPLPACAQTTLRFDPDSRSFIGAPDSPCRIDRLEIELREDAPDTLALTSPQDHALTFTPEPGAAISRPEAVGALARFERHPLSGPWTLEGDLDPANAGLVVNSYPSDPFDPPTDACAANEDQPDDTDFVCRLAGGSLTGVALEDGDDEDVFLLEGGFGGAFIQGQTIAVDVTTDADSDLIVELRALRARKALTTARRLGPGQWGLAFTVPPNYSGRYFAIHVRGAGALTYDIAAGDAASFEFDCADGFDDDNNGQTDCEDPRCASETACTSPIASPGDTLSLEGAIDEGDPTWRRPGILNADACDPDDDDAHFFETFAVTNTTGQDQVLTITAAWQGDGYLHAFPAPFDPDALDACIAGNDDFGGTSGSQIVDLDIADGQTITIVASTFDDNDPIGPFTIDVLTQP